MVYTETDFNYLINSFPLFWALHNSTWISLCENNLQEISAVKNNIDDSRLNCAIVCSSLSWMWYEFIKIIPKVCLYFSGSAFQTLNISDAKRSRSFLTCEIVLTLFMSIFRKQLLTNTFLQKIVSKVAKLTCRGYL